MCTQRTCDNAGLRGQQFAKPPAILLKVPAASLSVVFKVTDYMPLFVFVFITAFDILSQSI